MLWSALWPRNQVQTFVQPTMNQFTDTAIIGPDYMVLFSSTYSSDCLITWPVNPEVLLVYVLSWAWETRLQRPQGSCGIPHLQFICTAWMNVDTFKAFLAGPATGKAFKNDDVSSMISKALPRQSWDTLMNFDCSEGCLLRNFSFYIHFIGINNISTLLLGHNQLLNCFI